MEPIGRALFETAQAGDRDAFAEVVRTHFRIAWLTALAVVGDATHVEDVVQDAFVRCWQRIGQCRSHLAFAGWLRSVVRSVALNHLDREAVRATLSLDAVEAVGRESPERDLERSLLRDRIAVALRTLSTLQREVLLLHDLEGFKHAEIAGLTGISELVSRRHLSNARARMRRALEQPAPRRASR